MNTSTLLNFSPRARSMTFVFKDTATTEITGASSAQMIVLMTDDVPTGLVKTQM